MSALPRSFEFDPSLCSARQRYQIVFRLAELRVKDLSRFTMHDRRSGGDLSHVDLGRSTLNLIEHGDERSITRLRKLIDKVAAKNLREEARALRARGRPGQAAARLAQGPRPPSHGGNAAPLREGILSVNRKWFGGSGFANWIENRVEDFRRVAMAFLRTHFPGRQLVYAASHADEEAFHIHFVLAPWESRISHNRGRQILLRPAANPLLARYEHGQDLAGEHFAQLGLKRGTRRAAAVREARAMEKMRRAMAGTEHETRIPCPTPRRHLPPSQYRANEIALGRAEAAKTREAIRECCQTAARKMRQRLSRDQRKTDRARKRAEAVRIRELAKIAELRTEWQERVAALDEAQTEAAAIIAAARADAERILNEAEKTCSERRTELKDLETAVAAKQATVSNLRETLFALESSRDTAAAHAIEKKEELTQLEAQVRTEGSAVSSLRKGLANLEQSREATTKQVTQAREELAQLKTKITEGNARVAASMKAANQLEGDMRDAGHFVNLLAMGTLTIAPENGTILWGPNEPRDPAERDAVSRLIERRGCLGEELGAILSEALHMIVSGERAAIAKDVRRLGVICKELGLPEDLRLADLKRLYGTPEDDETTPGF